MIQEVDEACCTPLTRAPLDDDEADRLASALRVVADPTRLRLLSYLASCEGEEACVCDLTDPVGLTQPTISHHLRVLHEAGFVDRDKRGRWVFYRLRSGPLELLRRALDPKGTTEGIRT